MGLARVLGDEALAQRVKIYATDIDEEALDTARRGAYLPRQVEDMPREAFERFFERTDQRYVFRKDLRRSVIFGRNDLVQDAPISRIDLLVCRNVLMYFTAEVQAQILRRFHFALQDDGALMLGRSEMLVAHADLFTPSDLKRGLFRKVPQAPRRQRDRVLVPDPTGGASTAPPTTSATQRSTRGVPRRSCSTPIMPMVMANDCARRMFGLGVKDFGRPIQDLELSYRPIELRSHLDLVTERAASSRPQGVRGSATAKRGADLRRPARAADRRRGADRDRIAYIDVTEPRLHESS